jgi:hypothetical protein
MIKTAVSIGAILGAFSATAIAQPEMVSVPGTLKACDEPQLRAATTQSNVKSSVPVGEKETVSTGQPVTILSSGAGSVKVINSLYTQKDVPALFGKTDELLIPRGTLCASLPVTVAGEQLMKLSCRLPPDGMAVMYFVDGGGEFCNVRYHANRFDGRWMADKISSITGSPNELAVFPSGMRSVLVFLGANDGRVKFEIRSVGADGTIRQATPKEFDAASVIGNGQITVGLVTLHILGASAGLSVISCLRHNMLSRRVYASQTESPAGRAASDSRRAA